MNAQDSTSTRPYLIRALYEWCTDNGLTPYVAVRVDESVQVPREYVNDGEIVLNISFDATSSLQIGNDFIEFKARFGGKPRDILVPISRVLAIYARENGQGMAFPVVADTPSVSMTAPLQAVPDSAGDSEATEPLMQLVSTDDDADGHEPPRPPGTAGGHGKPALKRIK
jgi:stringent starvation protein B